MNKWIKFTDKIPKNDNNICVLLYEDWNKNKNGEKCKGYYPEENWHVCGGYYDKNEWYIKCAGVEGGICDIYNDYYEGHYIRAVAWYPMPAIDNTIKG